MKKIALISALAIGGLLSNTANAQIGIRLGFHFGARPVYVPAAHIAVEAPVYQDNVVVQDNDGDDYYYLPDVDAYYNVDEQSYYYNDGDNWVSAAYLPGHRDYDWRYARRFEVRASRPYLNDRFYSSRYGGYNRGSYEGRVYADRDFRRDSYRQPEQRFDNRNEWNRRDRAEQGFEGRGGYAQPQQFNNDRHDNGQPQQFNRGQGSFTQPSNGERNNGGQQRQNYRGAEDHNSFRRS
jgi:hypothetical protein